MVVGFLDIKQLTHAGIWCHQFSIVIYHRLQYSPAPNVLYRCRSWAMWRIAIVYSGEERLMKQLTKRQKWWVWFIALWLSGLGAIVLTVKLVRWTISMVSLNP